MSCKSPLGCHPVLGSVVTWLPGGRAQVIHKGRANFTCVLFCCGGYPLVKRGCSGVLQIQELFRYSFPWHILLTRSGMTLPFCSRKSSPISAADTFHNLINFVCINTGSPPPPPPLGPFRNGLSISVAIPSLLVSSGMVRVESFASAIVSEVIQSFRRRHVLPRCI